MYVCVYPYKIAFSGDNNFIFFFQLSKISLNNSSKERSQQNLNEKHSLALNEQICSVAYEKSRGEGHALAQKVLK